MALDLHTRGAEEARRQLPANEYEHLVDGDVALDVRVCGEDDPVRPDLDGARLPMNLDGALCDRRLT